MTWSDLIKYAKKNKAVIRKDYFILFNVLFHKSGFIISSQPIMHIDYDNMHDIIKQLSKNDNKSILYHIWMIIKKLVNISFKLVIIIIGFLIIKSMRGKK